MEKTFVKTVVTTTNAISIPIDGTDDFVLVYISNVDDQTQDRIIMKKEDYEKASSADELKPFKFKMPHQMKQNKYDSSYFVVDQNYVDAIINNGRLPDIKSGPHVFGAPLASDEVIIGYSYADNTFCYFDGPYINHIITDTYLSKYFDIYSIVENEQNNPSLVFGGRNSWSTGIYHVPGNGPTLSLGIKLTDEMFEKYKLSGDWFEKTVFLKENTILSKYVRPEDYSEDEEDY